MDILQALSSLFKISTFFGCTFKNSRSLKMYAYSKFFISAFIQITWFIYNFYWMTYRFDLEMLLTLFTFFVFTSSCVFTEFTVLHFDEKLLNEIVLINNLAFRKFRVSRNFFYVNIILIIFGILVSFVLAYFEISLYWIFYSKRDYPYIVEFFSISSYLIRTNLILLFFIQFLSYVIIIGICYYNINKIINAFCINKENFKKQIKYLKFLKSFDDSLKDFSETVTLTYSIYNVTIAVLTFSHLLYTLGFLLLNQSPRFITFRNSASFFIVIFTGSVVVCDLTKWQVIFLILPFIKLIFKITQGNYLLMRAIFKMIKKSFSFILEGFLFFPQI